MSQDSEMGRTIFQGSGTDSQGTKWFGTWELQVSLGCYTDRPWLSRETRTQAHRPPQGERPLAPACHPPFISAPYEA